MSYQLINISMAAREASKKAAQRKKIGKSSGRSHWPLAKIIAEAGRSPEASEHVINPLIPNLIHGMPLHELEALCYETAAKGRYENGKKLRKDTPILLTIVASFPRFMQIEDYSSYERWKSHTVNFVHTLYKSLLKTAVEHLDEEHPHLHFFILPYTARAKDIHPGYAAEKNVKDPKIKKQRHSEGLKRFQDFYWKQVGEPNGLERVGPARRRLARRRAVIERDNKRMIEDAERYCKALKSEAISVLKQAYDSKALELLKLKIDNETIANHNGN